MRPLALDTAVAIESSAGIGALGRFREGSPQGSRDFHEHSHAWAPPGTSLLGGKRLLRQLFRVAQVEDPYAPNRSAVDREQGPFKAARLSWHPCTPVSLA